MLGTGYLLAKNYCYLLNLMDINHSKIFFDPPPGVMEIKTKKQTGPNETSKLLHSKGNYKQDKKTTLRMGENICK